MLVHLGASVNHETSTGTTALFEAAKAREEGAIRALVDCGGPSLRRPGRGCTHTSPSLTPPFTTACANFETSHGETALTQLINSLSEDFLDSVRVRRLRDRRDMTAGGAPPAAAAPRRWLTPCPAGLFTVVPVSDSESDDGADAADAEEAARALEPVGDAAGNSDGGSDGAASGDAAHADTADQQEQQEDQVREATVEEEVEEEVDEEEELHYILYGVRSVRRTRRQRRTAARGELASVLRVLQLLVAEGAEVNRETSSGDSPLLRACALGALPIVDVLLRSGADMDHRSQTGVCSRARRRYRRRGLPALTDTLFPSPADAPAQGNWRRRHGRGGRAPTAGRGPSAAHPTRGHSPAACGAAGSPACGGDAALPPQHAPRRGLRVCRRPHGAHRCGGGRARGDGQNADSQR